MSGEIVRFLTWLLVKDVRVFVWWSLGKTKNNMKAENMNLRPQKPVWHNLWTTP